MKVTSSSWRQSLTVHAGVDYWPGPLFHGWLGIGQQKKFVTNTISIGLSPARQLKCTAHGLLCKNDPDCDVAEKFPGYEGNIPDIILEWPAHGPKANCPTLWLHLSILDGDQRYDPLEDYPAYDLDRQFDCRRKETTCFYGDQTIWWVYNDRGNIHTETSGGGARFSRFVLRPLPLPRTTRFNNMTFNN